jgi:AcrR family transcriptional regulator
VASQSTATATAQPLGGERAERIVDAMRSSVARRGVAGSTFDRVAREAGVSRGLLHYHFGTKEKLLVEVVRRESELRIAALEEQLAGATTADDFVDLLATALRDTVKNDPDYVTVLFELFTLSLRNEEVAAELSELHRRLREHVGAVLAAKQAEGVLHLRAEPEAIADVLFSLADGVAVRMLTEPGRDFSATVSAGIASVRALLD